ncbi:MULTISPECIES: hypothetical protein [Candidatus Ichthyocystis]|uniref:hypothetical protein n=1 Tax=Candidatus Ichthyocystis TaxID=2929841 RepID=UPI000B8A0086|nr:MULTISPECIES: hypothetical protein [Ichthyocystis]
MIDLDYFLLFLVDVFRPGSPKFFLFSFCHYLLTAAARFLTVGAGISREVFMVGFCSLEGTGFFIRIFR